MANNAVKNKKKKEQNKKKMFEMLVVE